MSLSEIFTSDFTAIEELIRRAFDEDRAEEDITSEACIGENVRAEAQIVLKQGGCIAGLKFLPAIFQLHNPAIETQIFVREGQMCEAGTVLALVQGPARALLSGERVALNFLQHLSGVATLTARCVALAETCQVLDTRKTIPGLRQLQKYAVRMGGGVNHRMDLADRILIKNNHLALASLVDCIGNARRKHPLGWIEVEIHREELLEIAIQAGANALLLDNMSPEQIRACVALVDKRVYLEASGGISLSNLAAYAATGVDGISIGALTHSAPALDISMRIQDETKRIRF